MADRSAGGRGLQLGPRDEAVAVLMRVGYYRLSGYWHPFRKIASTASAPPRLDEFQDGTTLEQVVQLYEFDRNLRLLVLDAIERVEVAARFHIWHVLGQRGSFAHTDPRSLDGAFAGQAPSEVEVDLTKWMSTIHREWLQRRSEEECRSKTDFVQHFKRKYGLPLPVWVVTEVFDFGGLSKLYEGLLQVDRDEIAAKFSLRDRSGAGNSSTQELST